MREIVSEQIVQTVRDLCIQAANVLPDDVLEALRRARDNEPSPQGRDALDMIVRNAEIAAREGLPMCQDTGVAVVFVELGQDVHVQGDLRAAITEGVRRGYNEGYLRKSMLRSPIDRVNTGDNAPPVIHWNVVPGDELKLIVLPKGGGSENKGVYTMLVPAVGLAGVKQYVIEAIEHAGASPCPPLIIGVGIGGTMDLCPQLAKHALLRPVGSVNPDPELAKLEAELLECVNALGVGPLGFGGRNTALAVHVETYPCHITSLPVAVNIQCHAARRAEATL